MYSDDTEFLIEPRPMTGFVKTPYVKDLTHRALNYIKAGFPLHLRGCSGTGKTTLAMHIANELGRPVVLVHGDDQLGTADLVGGEHGYRYRKLVDNFISRVIKTEEDMSKRWMDNRLTVACKNGYTLIYDEFTRSRPEANNILLSILQEKIMDMPTNREGGSAYLKTHPQFTAIFTSNPEEYAGVHKAQDALRDRMITLDLGYMDRETEISICQAKSHLLHKEAEKIVDIVRALRDSGQYEFAPTVRAAVMIARSCITHRAKVDVKDRKFHQICLDILSSETSRLGKNGDHEKVKKMISELVSQNGHLTNSKRRISRRKKVIVATNGNGSNNILFAKDKIGGKKNKNGKGSWFSKIFRISNKTTV